jgi:type VI secretion system protein ImpB
MPESTQHKLDRIRPPRVQITYDVEIGGAIQKKELPLVMGILADLSGKPEQPLPKLKDRKFVEIDRDNFNAILKSITPRATMQVDNKLSKEGGKTNIELKFQHIDDFSPLNIVQQVPALSELFKARQRLNDLLAKLDGNDKLDTMLRDLKDDEVKTLQGLPEQSEQPDAAKGGN